MRNNKSRPKPDVFYDTLKVRVAAALKEKGIDPIKDRGASIMRTLYYIAIFAACIWLGYAHITVC